MNINEQSESNLSSKVIDAINDIEGFNNCRIEYCNVAHSNLQIAFDYQHYDKKEEKCRRNRKVKKILFFKSKKKLGADKDAIGCAITSDSKDIRDEVYRLIKTSDDASSLISEYLNN